jgi:MFS family permease
VASASSVVRAPLDAAAAQRHETLILLILAGVCTTYSLMQTLALPAIPAFADDLDTSTAWATWVATAFLLVSAVTTPILGKLGDEFGRPRLLIAVLLVFLGGTIGAFAAWNIASLIAFRAVQGVSGAVFPLSFGIIRDEFRPERVTRAIGVLASVFGIGGGFGFVLAGLILDHLSWRFIFVVPAAPVAVGIWLVMRHIPDRAEHTHVRIDVPGAVLLAATLASLLLGVTEGSDVGFGSPAVVALLAAAVVLGVAWVRVELRSAAPLVPVRLMAGRTLLVTSGIAVISSMANFGTFVLVPAIAETPRHAPPSERHLIHYGLDLSATKAGLILLPLAFGMLFTAPVAARLGNRIGPKWTLALGLFNLVVLMTAMEWFHHTFLQLTILGAFQGIGFGFIYTSLMTIAVHGGPLADTGVVTGMVTTLRTIGAQLGAQGGAAILGAVVIAHTSVPRERAFEIAFAASGAIALVAAVCSVFVTPLRQSPVARRSSSL